MKLFANTNDITSKYNLYFNVDSTYHSLLKIKNISDSITTNKISKFILKKITYDSFQLIIILILTSG